MRYIKPKFEKRHHPSGVYKMTFSNRKFYIGSSKNLRRRFSAWKNSFKMTKHYHEVKNFMVWENFSKCKYIKFEVMEFTPRGTDPRIKEDFYIKQNWGNPLLLNRSNDAFVSRFKRTQEQKANVKTCTQKVAQFDLNNNLVKIHESLKSACAELFGHRMPISKCFNRSVRTCGGFRWKRVNTDGTFEEPPIIPNKSCQKKGVKLSEEVKIKMQKTKEAKRAIGIYPSNAKPVTQYDLDGKPLNHFPCIARAAQFIGATKRCFTKMVAESPRNYYKGYIWKYA